MPWIRQLIFTECSGHSGKSLPMESFEKSYIQEKLECIFLGKVKLSKDV